MSNSIKDVFANNWIEIECDNFNKKYKPEAKEYETYGKDKQHIIEQDVSYVWTCISVDGNEYLVQGWHVADRMYYIKTTVPFIPGDKECYCIWSYISSENREEE